MSVIKGAPHAIGLNRSLDTETEPAGALEWGLTHQYKNSKVRDVASLVSFTDEPCRPCHCRGSFLTRIRVAYFEADSLLCSVHYESVVACCDRCRARKFLQARYSVRFLLPSEAGAMT